jgi:hypothetical protein
MPDSFFLQVDGSVTVNRMTIDENEIKINKVILT